MHTQPSKPTSRGFDLLDFSILLVIVGVLAAFIVPQFTGFHDDSQALMGGQLQTIRSQILLYNVQNPATPYDETTPVGPAFWDPLIRGGYLQVAPINEFQNNSTIVGATPAMGTGWVWAPWYDMVLADDGLSYYLIFAVDENGNLWDSDEDGTPN
ncbi:MAG: type II secretion system protein [Planctomycetota bacterium]|jgi:type II secretory pathway pseudopilin PulG